MTLPIDRTTANTAAEHVADHNTLHAEYNVPTHAHSGAYAPLAGALSWVPAGQFIISSGTPTLGYAGRVPAWLFDAASVEQIRASYEVPTGWLTYAVDIYWSNSGAGAGDVRWVANQSQRAAGDALDAGEVGGAAIIAAPLLNILKITQIYAGITVDPTKKINYMRFERDASNVVDTLANDAGFLGLMLRRLT